MQDHAFTARTEGVDSTPATASFGHHSATPLTWASACRIHAPIVFGIRVRTRRFRNEIARDESMAFVAEISNQRLSGFQVESQECSTLNGWAGSDSRFGKPCRWRMRLQPVQSRSLPKTMVRSLSVLSWCVKVTPTTRQRIGYLPSDVERIAVGVGTVP